MSESGVSIERRVMGGMDYVTISDARGNRLSIPYEDWEDAQHYLGLTADSPDLIDRIKKGLYIDIGTRLVHEW